MVFVRQTLRNITNILCRREFKANIQDVFAKWLVCFSCGCLNFFILVNEKHLRYKF